LREKTGGRGLLAERGGNKKKEKKKASPPHRKKDTKVASYSLVSEEKEPSSPSTAGKEVSVKGGRNNGKRPSK